MKKIIDYLPLIYQDIWATLALALVILLIFNFKKIFENIKELFSEKNKDGTRGLLSTKRVGIMLLVLSLIYVFVFSMHTDRDIDHYAITVIGLMIMFGWNLINPDQAKGILDSLKQFTSITTTKKEETKKEEITKQQQDA